MLDFNYYSPTYFAFGRKVEEQAGEMVKRFGGSRVLIHYGRGSVVRSGLLAKVKASLLAENIFCVELGGAKPNPVASLVYKGIELCRRESVDFILGIGGGSAIDSAKAIAAGVYYNGDFWEMFAGRAVRQRALPVGDVLTLAATGTEASGSTVITNELDGKRKYGYGSDLLRPVFSLLNPELTFTVSPYQTACGATDMISHVFERYLSNTPDVALTDRLCEATVSAIVEAAVKAVHNPTDYEARATLLWGGTMAHSNILGVGREQDWSSHRLEHPLSARFDVAHGAGLAVIMPNFMYYTLAHDPGRYAMMAENIFGVPRDGRDDLTVGREGIGRFQSFLKSVGMPLTLTELGIKVGDIPKVVDDVLVNADGTLGHFSPLKRGDIVKVYEMAV